MVNNDTDELIAVLKALVASPQYANPTKEPKDWVAPSAVTGAAGGTADAVFVGPAVATAVVSMGKDGKGKAKSKAATSRRGRGTTGKAGRTPRASAALPLGWPPGGGLAARPRPVRATTSFSSLGRPSSPTLARTTPSIQGILVSKRLCIQPVPAGHCLGSNAPRASLMTLSRV